MSFLRTFFRLLLIIIGLGIIGAFATREVLLYLAARQVSSDATTLLQPARFQEQAQDCLVGQLVEDDPIEAYQLRFLDATSYVIEVQCGSARPVAKEEKSLPFGVRKTTGSAGFVVSSTQRDLLGELTLELWGQAKIVAVQNQGVAQHWGKSELRTDIVASSCSAHGMVCCDAQHEVGVGDPQSLGVNDCSGQCYTQCLRRPILLSFQTDPPIEGDIREITVPASEPLVVFSFAFDDGQAPIKEITLDYGDGSEQKHPLAIDRFSKAYTCDAPPCTFTARIRAVDERGIESAESRLSTIKITIQ